MFVPHSIRYVDALLSIRPTPVKGYSTLVVIGERGGVGGRMGASGAAGGSGARPGQYRPHRSCAPVRHTTKVEWTSQSAHRILQSAVSYRSLRVYRTVE